MHVKHTVYCVEYSTGTCSCTKGSISERYSEYILHSGNVLVPSQWTCVARVVYACIVQVHVYIMNTYMCTVCKL